jgi:hypothetical protein
MIWNRYWVFAPWIGGALVVILTMTLANIIEYGAPKIHVPAYDLDALFPRLASPKLQTLAGPEEKAATNHLALGSRFSRLIDEQRAAAN